MKNLLYWVDLALLAGCASPAAKKPAETVRQTLAAAPAGLATTAAQEFGPLRVPIKTVGILLYDGYSMLDAMGPYQVLSEIPGVQVKLIAERKGLCRDAAGTGLEATDGLADVKALDVLVIPGGLGGTYQAAHDTAIVNWVRRIDQTTTYTTSVCTGAWVLGAAGMLRGKPATTHWYGKQLLEQEYGAHYEPKRYVRSGKYWTSAGITAGMDMALALVNDIAGEQYTRAAMLDLEYAPEPPFKGGTEASTAPRTTAWFRALYDRGMATAPARPTAAGPGPADPVCGMALPAGAHPTAVYRDNTYGFCSATCQATFKRAPAHYVER